MSNDYADAINAAVQERRQQLRDYGGFLAQAGIPLEEADHKDLQVTVGYAEQVRAYPEG